MSNDTEETLELKVTVRGKNLDRNLLSVQRVIGYADNFLGLVRAAETPAVSVVKIERADGQEIGLRYEFESWWEENRCEGDAYLAHEKSDAWAAFKFGYELGQEN